MSLNHHLALGDQTGNPNQKPGKHEYGIEMIPLGNRDRAYNKNIGFDVVEDRDCDPNIRRI